MSDAVTVCPVRPPDGLMLPAPRRRRTPLPFPPSLAPSSSFPHSLFLPQDIALLSPPSLLLSSASTSSVSHAGMSKPIDSPLHVVRRPHLGRGGPSLSFSLRLPFPSDDKTGSRPFARPLCSLSLSDLYLSVVPLSLRPPAPQFTKESISNCRRGFQLGLGGIYALQQLFCSSFPYPSHFTSKPTTEEERREEGSQTRSPRPSPR